MPVTYLIPDEQDLVVGCLEKLRKEKTTPKLCQSYNPSTSGMRFAPSPVRLQYRRKWGVIPDLSRRN